VNSSTLLENSTLRGSSRGQCNPVNQNGFLRARHSLCFCGGSSSRRSTTIPPTVKHLTDPFQARRCYRRYDRDTFNAIAIHYAKIKTQISKPLQSRVPTSYPNLDQHSRGTTRNSLQRLNCRGAARALDIQVPIRG
jgi:hypothetical protein